MIVNNRPNNTSFQARLDTPFPRPEILKSAINEMEKMFAKIPRTENDTVLFRLETESDHSCEKQRPIGWLYYEFADKSKTCAMVVLGEFQAKSAEFLECFADTYGKMVNAASDFISTSIVPRTNHLY